MSRCRFVQPDVVRLFLVDVHRRALKDLQDPAKQAKLKLEDRATPEAIANAEAAIRAAEADGAFIDIKRELNAGEQRRLFAHMMRDMTVGDKVTLIPEQVGRTKVIAYLIGWSFVAADGQPVPVSESAIDNLDTETYSEITQAIDAHEEAEAEKKESARKHPTIATGSKAISESVA